MTDNPVLIEQLGSVRRITLNRPHVRNAQSRQMLDALDQAFQEAEQDVATNVVILAANGDHFSAGHDLKQAQAERSGFTVEQRWQYESQRYYDYCLRIWDFPKPTIAQVQGGCVAAGMMLANMCDLIVASEDAFFADLVTHSMAGASTEVLIHPWVMGLRNAKELLFTGGKISAQEAKSMGMVNRVVPTQELESTTLELAQRVAKGPAFTLSLVKKSLNRSVDVQGFRAALSAHFDLHQLSHLSDEFRTRTSAGMDKTIVSGSKV